MLLKVSRSKTSGRVKIPGSKSHTIRALFIASLAEGRSEIIYPLISDDAVSAVKTCKAMGADVKIEKDRYIVDGFNGIPKVPDNVIDVGNSGTTLRFATAASALGDGYSVFTGDEQIRRRPIGPLLEALNNLGAQAFSTRGDGRAPLVVKGRMTGGRTPLDSVTSQYLSALLISTPLLEKDTEIDIIRLNEVPYVDITLWWLDKQNIRYENSSYRTFYIPGGQKYKPFKEVIPGDFSSATFFMVLAAISGGEFILENLDISDPQGDRQVLDILKSMGVEVRIDGKNITISGRELIGREIDMNSIPDALPAMAVAGCFAEGETRLVNVPQARLKETDRIRVMYEELSKLGADVEELPDGLIIRQSKLKGCPLNGHGDHRIVMALAVAGLNIDGDTVIDTAESISVTFPEFVDLVKACGGNAELVEQS